MQLNRFTAIRYAVPTLASAVATLLTLLLDPLIEPNVFTLLLAAVAISAWSGGQKPGLLATLLCALAGTYFLLPPYQSLAITSLDVAGARQIVEQHGGTIVVESEEGKGSAFTVRLPLVAPGAADDTALRPAMRGPEQHD